MFTCTDPIRGPDLELTVVSTGGVDVLALFVLGWDIRRCRQFFSFLAADAFQPRAVTCVPGLATIHRWALAYLHDGLYPAAGIDGVLSRCFGTEIAIDDGRLAASAYGTHVAATIVMNPSADYYLVTNYNGLGRRPQHCSA